MADFNFFLNRQGPKGAQGVKGDTGFSPTIAPSADNDGLTTYKLVITNENNTYETDNLMGNLDIVDDGGTYLRYNREAGSVSASEADTATASAAGVVKLANSTDYANLADDAVMTPSSFVDNYNSLISAGTGIEIFQNLVNDKIVIGIDDSTIVTEADLASALSSYATQSMLSDYVTTYYFNATLQNNYVSNSALSSTLSNYVTSSNLSNTLANYVTNSNLSSTLAGYVTSSALGTTLSDYVTDSELSTALNSYVKNASLTTTLSNYMTLDTEQGVSATKTFTADQDINGIRIGQNRVSRVNGNLALQSYTDEYGDPTSSSTILYLGSGGVSVMDGQDHSYQLIYTSNGLIPDARLSSNIARTSQIPDISTKQDTLVSGTNIKTINGQDILGSGNITIQGGSGGTVDQTFNGSSANAQSGVAIAGAGFLQNAAGASGALAILGTTSYNYAIALGEYANANDNSAIAMGYYAYANYPQTIALGIQAQATAAGTVAIGGNATATAAQAHAFGYLSEASASGATALGYEAKATASGALQIGTGTNNTANTLQVSSYTLLDTSTGLIPDARISTTIDRISAIESRLSAIEAALNQ